MSFFWLFPPLHLSLVLFNGTRPSTFQCIQPTASHLCPSACPHCSCGWRFPFADKPGEKKKIYNAICLSVCPLMWIIQNCNNITPATCCCTETRPGVSALTACTQFLHSPTSSENVQPALSVMLTACVHIHPEIRQQIEVRKQTLHKWLRWVNE